MSIDTPADIDQIATRIAGQYLDAPISCASLYRAVADALMAERASTQAEILRLRALLDSIIARDDRNGSLPEWYRHEIDANYERSALSQDGEE